MRRVALLALVLACGPAPRPQAPPPSVSPGAGEPSDEPSQVEWQEGRPIDVPECAIDADPERIAVAVRTLRHRRPDPGAADAAARFEALDPEGPNPTITHTAFLAGNITELLPWIALVRRGRITPDTPVMEEAGDSPHRRAFEALLRAPERDAILAFLERALPRVAGMVDPFAPPVGLPECDETCRTWLLGYLDATAPTDGPSAQGPSPPMLSLVGALRLEEAEPRLLAWVRARRHFHQLHTDYDTRPEPVADGFTEAVIALAVLARADGSARDRIRSALVAECRDGDDVVWFSETHDRMDGTYDRSEPRERRIGEALALSKRPLLRAAVAAIDGVSEARWQLMGGERASARPTWQLWANAEGMEVVGDWLCLRDRCLDARTGQRVARFSWVDGYARVEAMRTFGPHAMVTVLTPRDGAPRRLVVFDPTADTLESVTTIAAPIGRVGTIERTSDGYVLVGEHRALLLDERGRRRSIIELGRESRVWLADDGRAFVRDTLGLRLYPPGWEEPRLVDRDTLLDAAPSRPLEGVAFVGSLTILGTPRRVVAVHPDGSLAWSRSLDDLSAWVPCGAGACVLTNEGRFLRFDATGTQTVNAEVGDDIARGTVANDRGALLIRAENIVSVDFATGEVGTVAPAGSRHLAKLVGITPVGAVFSTYEDGQGHRTMLVPLTRGAE